VAGTVGNSIPGPMANPGWLNGERRQRPPSYRGTPATSPPLPTSSQTAPAVVAAEDVCAGQA